VPSAVANIANVATESNGIGGGVNVTWTVRSEDEWIPTLPEVKEITGIEEYKLRSNWGIYSYRLDIKVAATGGI
nr:hypothetical protein [Tanacetum cinerariifolium]